MKINLITVEEFLEFKESLVEELSKIINQDSVHRRKKWLRSKEVCEYLNISNSSLQTLRINGSIPYRQVERTLLYDLEEINAFLENNKKGGDV